MKRIYALCFSLLFLLAWRAPCQALCCPCAIQSTVYAGVEPTIFTNLGTIFRCAGTESELSLVGVELYRNPAFDKTYDLPATLRFEVGLFWNRCFETFVYGSLVHARGRERTVLSTDGSTSIHLSFGDYTYGEAQAGLRWYTDAFCCCDLRGFAGVGGGVLIRPKVHAEVSDNFGSDHLTIYERSVTPTFFAQVGITKCLGCRTRLVILGQVTLSSPFCPNNGAITTGTPAYSFGNTGPVLSFPVLIGISRTL